MEFPDHLSYSEEHEWIHTEGDKAKVGVTGYAIEQLGDIVHVELPAPGDEFEAGAPFGTIESTKTVSDLYMPVECKVLEVNDSLADHPEVLQESPYDKGWLVRIEVKGTADSLMSAEKYGKFIEED